VAFRNIQGHKGYAFINIAGLAIGLAVCALIMLWVLDELSYDRFHERADRIYRLLLDADIGGHLRTSATMPPAGPTMTQDYPEVENFTRYGRLQSLSVEYEDKQLQESLVGFADASFFEIFSIPFLSGDPATALKNPYTIVITEDMAQKYFGTEDPMGKILRIGGETDYTVTGVVKNVPRNSHIRPNMLRSFETLAVQNPRVMQAWLNVEFRTYLLLTEHADWKAVEAKFPDLVEQHLGERLRALGGRLDLFLQPMTSIHLYSSRDYDVPSAGDIRYVTLFSGIALFVLLIAAINFVNLSTARSANRAREVGMRKTLGALRKRLVFQFLGESLVYSLLAMILAIGLTILALPSFNNIVGRELSIHILQIIPGFIGLALLIGLVAGSYPAFVLSSFQPVSVLKGGMTEGASNARFRKVLVVLQFAISIALIVGTLTIFNQIQFIKNKRLGFDQEQVLVLPQLNQSLIRRFSSIKHELNQIPGVVSTGGSSYIPGTGRNVGIFLPEGFSEDQRQTMQFLGIDHDYIPMMNMELALGRNFSADLATDTSESVLINEAAVRQFGWENPIGKAFYFQPPPGQEGETNVLRVVGVVKDFHMASLREEIIPMILFYDPVEQPRISVRLAPDDIPGTLDRLRIKWMEIDAQRPFDYFFLDETIRQLYESEERVASITLYFSVLAIFIGCLGLFGLAAFMAEKRTKEIGIRKVLGASVHGIIGLISREFIVLVAIANVIAWPVAYFGLKRWMEAYAYRAGISWVMFILAGMLALIIALLTVSYQAIKAARTNPSRSLRYE
jgi:putative ABC transport system permease protein